MRFSIWLLSIGLLCGLLLLNTKVNSAQTSISFLAPRAYDGGIDFATKDFNGDGNLDIVSAKADSLTFLKGNGSGTFPNPPVTVSNCLGNSSTGAVNKPFADDFNNDGKIDIAAWVENATCTGTGLRALEVLPGNGDGTFSAPIYTNVSNFFFTPNKFVSSDFNGDGRPDIAVGISFSGTGDKIAVFMNNGDGTFAEPVTYNTPSQFYFDLMVGDFNNDNRPEIIYARYPFDMILLPNNGDGTFAAPITVASGPAFGVGTVGDFNGDGKSDFAVIRSGNNPAIQAWLGNGNNTFSPGPVLTLSVSNTNIVGISSADYDNDGLQDIALSLNCRTLILKGMGNGVFAEDALYGVGGGRLFKGDFNNDGWMDLATPQTLAQLGSAAGSSSEFAVLQNLQNGNFLTGLGAEIPFGGEELAVADFNNDRLLDIAFTGDATNGEIILVLQDPNALFNTAIQPRKKFYTNRIAVGGGIIPHTLATGDFNRDGNIDVVIAGTSPSGMTDNVIVARNDGNGNLSILTTLRLSGTVTKVVAADFNADGILDLAFSQNRETQPTTNPAVSVALGNNNGTFSSPVGYLTNAVGVSIAEADFNRDGRPDLAVGLNNAKVTILINNGSGNFSENGDYDMAALPTKIATADLNGDNNQDLIVACTASISRVCVLNGNGNGTFSGPINYITLGSYNQRLTVDDFSGDGKPDVAVTNNGVLTVLENDGQGNLTKKSLWASTGALNDITSADLDGDQKADIITTSGIQEFRSIGFLPNITSATGSQSAPFDFDGDGKTDVSVFRPSLGQWWVYRSSDGGNLGVQFGASTDVISPGDFTGDGKTDMAFFRPSTGQWFILRSEDFSFYGFQFGTNGDIPTPADFDGDGKTDVAVFRPSSAAWYVFRSSDSGVTALNFGLSTDKPAAADYDGDGKADVAVWRPNGATGGEWWILKSSTGSVYGASFGTSTDKTVQGDYTGDGKADIAFFRPSTGFWYVLRSEDFSFYGFPFGTNGDTPAPGDYDGDGKFDAAVFRQPGAQWFVNSSSGTPFSLSFGAPNDAPVPNAFVR